MYILLVRFCVGIIDEIIYSRPQYDTENVSFPQKEHAAVNFYKKFKFHAYPMIFT